MKSVTRPTVSFRLDQEQHAELLDVAAGDEKSPAHLVEEIVVAYLQGQGRRVPNVNVDAKVLKRFALALKKELDEVLSRAMNKL